MGVTTDVPSQSPLQTRMSVVFISLWGKMGHQSVLHPSCQPMLLNQPDHINKSQNFRVKHLWDASRKSNAGGLKVTVSLWATGTLWRTVNDRAKRDSVDQITKRDGGFSFWVSGAKVYETSNVEKHAQATWFIQSPIITLVNRDRSVCLVEVIVNGRLKLLEEL